mgnify:CR=1 FL=1
MAIETDDQNLALGQNPIFAYDEEAATWRRVRCDGDGVILVALPPSQSDVEEPTTTPREIHDGPAVVVSVTNTTTQIITILDDTNPVALVLPLASLVVPVSITTRLMIKSAGLALGKEVATIWRTA